MGGGLMQLVAYGAQDIYLTGNPQITFFKVVYRRHTNFSMESIQQTLNGTADFGARVSATISRNGDLVSKLWYEMDPSAVCGTSTAASPNPMHSIFKSLEIEIGGQRIDKHYHHWLNVWTELTEETCVSKVDAGGLYRASDAVTVSGDAQTDVEVHKAPSAYQRMACAVKPAGVAVAENYAIVPLQFWFCRNPGLALPLIALQYHEVKLITEFEDQANSVGGSDGSLSGVTLYADYIYLDTDERRRFAQVSHEYLIEQLQYQNESAATSFTLNFNHPVKELIWAGARAAATGANGSISTPMPVALHATPGTKLHDEALASATTCKLRLNGHDRFSARHQAYFTRCQPWTYHSNPGGGVQSDAISVYSFALKPEEHQPSGTCNFSRIDNAQLEFSAKVCGGSASEGLHIYAVNYNVLRIMSGMGGLAYSN